MGRRVAAGRPIEPHRRLGTLTGMNGADLPGQDALVESSVAGPQKRPAVVAELRGDAETRRDRVPCVHRAQAADEHAGFVSVGIERPERPG